MLSLENAAGRLSSDSSKNIYKLRFFFKDLYLDQTQFKNMKKHIHNTRTIIKPNLRSWFNENVTKICLNGKNDNFPLILFLELFSN